MGYKIISRCTLCEGTGYLLLGAEQIQKECPNCGGGGEYAISTDIEGLSIELTGIITKVQEVKTKVNQMQADISYIKTKVG